MSIYRTIGPLVFYTIMLRNHSYLPHRYSIRFALFLMTLDTRVHAGGGARGQNLGHLIFFFFLMLLKNDILFSI